MNVRMYGYISYTKIWTFHRYDKNDNNNNNYTLNFNPIPKPNNQIKVAENF